jgi:cysteinyl-tRNA synthetase
MALRLFNTLSRSVEEFRPLQPDAVTLYTCGPTVWNYAHIGNFRTFVFQDVLRRYLEYQGHRVRHVMNLTDVDDRTIAAAGRAGVPLAEHTRPYAEAFFEDRDYLRILPAHHYPAATGEVPAMVELVSRLLEKGVAYRGDDGSVYFAIDRFPSYGRLSRLDRRELRLGARVLSDEYAKEDARDFVLWKATRPEDEAVGAAWDAPFGRGRPGWHLECSAMSMKYLGETLDIHAGGVDLVFPHHEDEIAQSEAATGRPFARYWVHGEFLTVSGTKMSKRYGNILTARDLKENGVNAAAVRVLFCQTHYRKQLNFTDEALGAASAGAARLAEFHQRLAGAQEGNSASAEAWRALEHKLVADFGHAMDDDLEMPRALAAIMEFAREGNRLLAGGGAADPQRTLGLFDRVCGVLQVLPEPRRVISAGPSARAERAGADELSPPTPGEDLEVWARRIALLRAAARSSGDWARADAARKLLMENGFEVRDRKDGGFELRGLNKPPDAT